MQRNIIQINDSKCTGCGACLTHCAENALASVDGKARLLRDSYCDGLGACLGVCPEGALTIIQREAAPFDETQLPPEHGKPAAPAPRAAAGCPGSTSRVLTPLAGMSGRPAAPSTAAAARHPHRLRTWPVQLRLLPADADFLRGAHLLLAADCAGFALPDLSELLRDRVLLIACPKLDDAAASTQKLADICRTAQPRSLTILRMSVPCCGGLEQMAERALRASDMSIPVRVELVDVG